MEENVGIYRNAENIQKAIDKISELKKRYADIELTSPEGHVFDYAFTRHLELGFMLDVAETMALSAFHRNESRGSHQRLDGPEGAFQKRNDNDFLKHTLAFYKADQSPEIQYKDVTITSYPPGERVYGGEKK